MIGFIEVLKNFDVSKGVSFEIFVGIRICGVMFDEICWGDWVLCFVYWNVCLVVEIIVELESILNCEFKDIEVVEKFDIILDEYYYILYDVNLSKVLGIEDLGVDEDVIILMGYDLVLDKLFNNVKNEWFN